MKCMLILAFLYGYSCLTCALALVREVHVFPCDKHQEHFNVSVYSGDVVIVPANLSLCDTTWNSGYNGFRITTNVTIGHDVSNPVVFVAIQPDSDGIVSWNVPLDLELNGTSASDRFWSISHTMCPFKYKGESSSNKSTPLFSIEVFTHSEDAISYLISVEPVKDFVIRDANDTYSTVIKPPSPQVFYYKIPDGQDIVTIEVKNASEAVGCIFVSIQNNTCPFSDLLVDKRELGMYQSMTQSAFLTVKAGWVKQREFLLILTAANYSICHDPPFNQSALSLFLKDGPGQNVTIEIRELTPTEKYEKAIWFPVLIAIAIALFSSIAVGCCYSVLCQSCCVPIRCIWTNVSHCYWCVPCYSEGPCKLICELDSRLDKPGKGPDKDKRGTDKYEKSSCAPCGPWVCVCFLKDDDRTCTPCGDDHESDSDDSSAERRDLLDSSKHKSESSALEESGVQIAERKTNDRGSDRERYLQYGWSTFIVGIFYALPAFQLIFFQQLLLNNSGNQDLCYYNFKCAHPVTHISAFNNVWSNICYVILGLSFCAIVLYRNCQYKRKIKNPQMKKYWQTHGVPQYFGIYYALGIALVLEGFMSSFYHICPSNANFQFDTAFMFIIGGLLFVKVFQNRHPDMNVNAFVAFFCFALIIFYTVVGIYNDRDHPLAIKIVFLLLVVFILIPFILISFYALKYKSRKLLNKTKATTTCGEIKHQIRKWYTFRHVVIVLVNIGVGIYLAISYNGIGIATDVLIFIVMNVVLYLVLYFLSKILNREPLTLLTLVLPILIGLSWAGAFKFYGSVTEWAIPPAQSRAKNERCVLFGFYDDHDIWHMLSACGMFFALLFVLVIDDGVANCETKKLKVF